MSTPSMSCPSGGQFYACATGSRFVGCCGSDPCGNNGCAAGNLVATSFDAAEYGSFSDQQCDGGLFYTCSGTSPPFWGCCQSNPCSSSGCPASDLSPAFLSGNPALAAPFLALNGSVSTSTSSSSQVSSTTSTSADLQSTVGPASTSTNPNNPSTLSTSTTSGATSVPTSASASGSTSPAAPSPSSTDTGAIVGGAVGGFAVLVGLILGLVWLLRRRRNGSKHTSEQNPTSEIQHTSHGLGLIESPAVKDQYIEYPSTSPTSPSYPGSPQPLYSSGPPSYIGDERAARHFSYELPGSPGGQEMDSGQRYHAYRQ